MQDFTEKAKLIATVSRLFSLKLCACLPTTLLLKLTMMGYRSVESSSEKRSTPCPPVPT